MSVLSDKTIKDLMKSSELIGGIADLSPEKCSFSFPASKIFSPSHKVIVNWDDANETREFYAVEPGNLVWIKTKGRVRLPRDICAFWWQTNTLSRKGLMLVNMSMVEPGYTGSLSCLFVNFGKDPVLIHKDQPVARLVFMRIDQDVEKPYEKNKSEKEYDQQLSELMMTGPNSFLQIAQLSKNIEDAEKQFEQQKQAKIQEINEFSESLRKNYTDAIKEDSANVFKKTFGIAITAFLILNILISSLSWIKEKSSPKIDDLVRKAVSDEIAKRMVFQAEPSNGDTENLPKEAEKPKVRKSE